MSIIESCGWVAVLISCAIVVFAVLLVALAMGCLILGACDSATNPNASEDARESYQNVTTQIGAGTVGLNRAVENITGGT